MSERIIIELDDAELDEALNRIIVIGGEAEDIIGDKNLYQRLPTINRELRLILSQIPGMREAITLWYRARRMIRGIELGGLSFYLTLAATLIILIKQILEYQRRIERRQKEYEMMIRQYRGFTHEEYLEEMERWKLYNRGMPP